MHSRRPFNVLDVTGVGADEVQHSSIIAWLLAPYESHGCGTLFLEQFLSAAGIALPGSDLSGCRVRTEFVGHEAIIDILVYRPNDFVIYIENKTFAAEQPQQVDREYRDMILLADVVRVSLDRAFAVFLTPSGRPPVSGDPKRWRTISYRQLARQFEGIQPNLGGKVGFFVEDLVGQYDRWSSA